MFTLGQVAPAQQTRLGHQQECHHDAGRKFQATDYKRMLWSSNKTNPSAVVSLVVWTDQNRKMAEWPSSRESSGLSNCTENMIFSPRTSRSSPSFSFDIICGSRKLPLAYIQAYLGISPGSETSNSPSWRTAGREEELKSSISPPSGHSLSPVVMRTKPSVSSLPSTSRERCATSWDHPSCTNA